MEIPHFGAGRKKGTFGKRRQVGSPPFVQLPRAAVTGLQAPHLSLAVPATSSEECSEGEDATLRRSWLKSGLLRHSCGGSHGRAGRSCPLQVRDFGIASMAAVPASPTLSTGTWEHLVHPCETGTELLGQTFTLTQKVEHLFLPNRLMSINSRKPEHLVIFSI